MNYVVENPCKVEKKNNTNRLQCWNFLAHTAAVYFAVIFPAISSSLAVKTVEPFTLL